jgi:hypothetical protein
MMMLGSFDRCVARRLRVIVLMIEAKGNHGMVVMRVVMEKAGLRVYITVWTLQGFVCQGKYVNDFVLGFCNGCCNGHSKFL